MRAVRFILLLFLPIIAIGQSDPVSGSRMNPNISLIGDLRGSFADLNHRKFNFAFEEAELTLNSSIDPYARADVFLAYARNADGEYDASLEEAYVSTLSFPLDLRIRAGRFRLSLGRLNALHPHALPFTDLPALNANYLGEEGLVDDAVSVSWIVPNPFDFYQEFVLEAGNVPIASPMFRRPEVSRYLYLAHLKNFWDLDENTTLELGFSGITGPNEDLRTTIVGAADLTLKWKPLKFNTYRSLTWQSELLVSRYGMADGGDVSSWGMYSYLTWQVGQRWFLTGRYDYANHPRSAGSVDRGYSTTLGWYASEFQKIEVGAKLSTGNTVQSRTEAVLRWVFVIGAHGAHAY